MVVTGSRSLDRVDPDKVASLKQEFVWTIGTYKPEHVFHGGAAGPDSWAQNAYPELATTFRPLITSDREASSQLKARNMFMINSAIREDTEIQVIACWDGVSRGTKHAFEYAWEMGLPVDFVGVSADKEEWEIGRRS